MKLFRRFKSSLGQTAVYLVRTRPGRYLVRFMVVKMSFALPVDKLRQTQYLLAFYHPQPVYPVHILIVPRYAVDSLLSVSHRDTAFLVDLFDTVKSLVTEIGLEKRGYRLITNGGAYQDFPLLHFHLVSGAALDQSKQQV